MSAIHSHSLLSRPAILEHRGKGVIIHPFIDNHLKTASYDVRIGQYFYKRKATSETHEPMFNPYDSEAVKRHFGHFHTAESARCIVGYQETPHFWKGIEPDDLVILLQPGEMILGHTDEYIGGTKDPQTNRCFLAEMKARSSVGRMGLEVCRCAGWGDVGYVNRWTMEIVNTSNSPVPIIVGMRIAQMKFYEVDPVADEDLYGADVNRDHYQVSIDLEQLQKNWKPELMLPRITKT
jgi:dCTP deaminase